MGWDKAPVAEVDHAAITAFAASHVNLPHEQAKKHRGQVNGLRDRLKAKIDADADYGLVKSLHAGSVAKRTALKNVNDLDLAVYIKAAQAPTKDDAQLVSWLADRLFEASANMTRDQFEEQQHCVTVHFSGSHLDVDVVPVLYEGEPNDIGYLVRKWSGRRLKTSTRLHLDFIASRRTSHGDELLELIRLTKWWKRQIQRRDETFKCKSFMLELIWAHLVDNGTPVSDYTRALEDFFAWIVRTELRDQVAFTDFEPASELPSRGISAIQVLDPVNFDNNVAEQYQEYDRKRIVTAAQEAYDAITDARFATTKGRAVDDWQTILGPTFKG